MYIKVFGQIHHEMMNWLMCEREASGKPVVNAIQRSAYKCGTHFEDLQSQIDHYCVVVRADLHLKL